MLGKQLTACDRAVLLAVALRIDDASGTTWPSRKTIAIDAGYTLRHASKSLAKLRNLGLLESKNRYRDDGGQTSDLRWFGPRAAELSDAYKEQRKAGAAPASQATPPVSRATPPRVMGDTLPVTRATPLLISQGYQSVKEQQAAHSPATLSDDERNELGTLRSQSRAAGRYAFDPTTAKAEALSDVARERLDQLAAIESAEKAAEAEAQRRAYDEARAAKLKALADRWDADGPVFATTDPRRPFKLPGAVLLRWMQMPEFDGVNIESLLRQFAEQFAADKTKRRAQAKTEIWLLSFLRQSQKSFAGTTPPPKPVAARGERRW